MPERRPPAAGRHGWAGSAPGLLDLRARNRALLARQHLLGRSALTLSELVERLLGLQAQATRPPYYGLWSRLERFDRGALGRALVDRELVRLTLMRGTVHLVTVGDARVLRPLMQPGIERGFKGAFGRRMGGADPARLAATVHELLAAGPLTARELGRELTGRGIGDDLEAIGNAARVVVPLVQIPPRGIWEGGGQARYATLEAWTGGALEPAPSLETVILRYLGAFGPATTMDVQSWSGLTRLGEVLERLAPQLVRYRDERGRELFDLPGAPRPDPDTPAPPRFLGEFDNVLLGHADRGHVIPEGMSQGALREGRAVGSLLVDGMLEGAWWFEDEGKDRTRLVVRPARALSMAERKDVLEEAERLAEFAAEKAVEREIRLLAAR